MGREPPGALIGSPGRRDGPGGIERLDLRHVLVREVILTSLSAPRRQELHARLADAIEAHPAIAGASSLERNARLASHRLMARQLERAVPPLLREATAAEDMRAFVIADQAYRRALDAISQLGVDAVVREDLPTTLERAALAASLAGDPSRAVRLAQDALATGPDEADRTVRLRLHLGGYLAEAGSHERALATLIEAADAAPPGTILQVRCGTARARELLVHGRFDEAAREARTQAEDASRLRARPEEAAARAVEASALARLGRLADALAALRLAPLGAMDRVSSRSRSRPSRFGAAMQSYLDRATVFEQAGDAAAAARLALDGRDEAARRGLSGTMGVVMTAVAAHGLLQTGGWDEASDLLAGVDPRSGDRHQLGSGMVRLARASSRVCEGSGTSPRTASPKPEKAPSTWTARLGRSRRPRRSRDRHLASSLRRRAGRGRSRDRPRRERRGPTRSRPTGVHRDPRRGRRRRGDHASDRTGHGPHGRDRDRALGASAGRRGQRGRAVGRPRGRGRWC